MTRRYLCFLLAMLWACIVPTAAGAASINQSGFVRIGGIDQWIGVSGQSAANPMILVVHGGPGEAQWPQAAKYKPWERAFTVVQWDQRGAGRTYGRYKAKTPNVNLKQIVSDGIEVAEYLRRTYHKRKIIVFGHSWGSIVATDMVQRKPALFAAYVGSGQVVSWARTVQFQFDHLLARANAVHDMQTVKMLETIGKPDPRNAAQYFGFTRNYMSVMAPSDQVWLKGLRTATPLSLGIGQEDFQNLIEGMQFSGQQLWADTMASDLPKTAPIVDTAFFLIQGRDDVITPTVLAVDYFNHVEAPVKKLVLIDGGHFAFMTNGKQFLKALMQTVRPMAISRGA